MHLCARRATSRWQGAHRKNEASTTFFGRPVGPQRLDGIAMAMLVRVCENHRIVQLHVHLRVPYGTLPYKRTLFREFVHLPPLTPSIEKTAQRTTLLPHGQHKKRCKADGKKNSSIHPSIHPSVHSHSTDLCDIQRSREGGKETYHHHRHKNKNNATDLPRRIFFFFRDEPQP